MRGFNALIILLVVALLSGCATSAVQTAGTNPDPYEHYNRNAYRLNDSLDKHVLKPVAVRYVRYVPHVIRTGVTNFFSNLYQIQNITNDVLQANFYWTMNDFWRFIINSTVGIAGLFDPASHVGLTKHVNTFGLTLDTWGVTPAPYFMLPILGPGTLGEVNALPADFYVSPWYFYSQPLALTASFYVLNGVNTRSQLLQQEDLAMQLAFDPYAFIRTVYLQYRTGLLYKNANPPLPALAEQNQ